MTNLEKHNPQLALRPATADDVFRIAEMLVALYELELPGALRGPHAARRALLAHTLEADSFAGLRGRHLIVSGDQIVGTFAMRRAFDPPQSSAPPGTLRRGIELFGGFGAARMFGTLARATLTRPPDLGDRGVHLHGVFVDEHERRRGAGRLAIASAERLAREAGCRDAHLQVLATNEVARRFWESIGYRVSRPSGRTLLPTFPVDTMSKAL